MAERSGTPRARSVAQEWRAPAAHPPPASLPAPPSIHPRGAARRDGLRAFGSGRWRSYRPHVDFVVFRMRASEPDAGNASGVVELHDNAIVVAAHIEHDAIAADNIGPAKDRLDLSRIAPARLFHFLLPCSNTALQRPALSRAPTFLPDDQSSDDVKADDHHVP